MDISESSCTVTGLVGAGEVKLVFDFLLVGGAGNAWVDGFQLDFPEGQQFSMRLQ